jgi:hypothetical protein
MLSGGTALFGNEPSSLLNGCRMLVHCSSPVHFEAAVTLGRQTTLNREGDLCKSEHSINEVQMEALPETFRSPRRSPIRYGDNSVKSGTTSPGVRRSMVMHSRGPASGTYLGFDGLNRPCL